MIIPGFVGAGALWEIFPSRILVFIWVCILAVAYRHSPPAHFAGVKPGVLILEVNRKGVKSVQEFLEAIAGSKSVLLLVQQGQYSRYVILKID